MHQHKSGACSRDDIDHGRIATQSRDIVDEDRPRIDGRPWQQRL